MAIRKLNVFDVAQYWYQVLVYCRNLRQIYNFRFPNRRFLTIFFQLILLVVREIRPASVKSSSRTVAKIKLSIALHSYGAVSLFILLYAHADQ